MNTEKEKNKPAKKVNMVARKLTFSNRLLPLEIQALIRRLQKNYTFFSDMYEDEIVRFLPLCRRENYDKREAIFREGDPSDAFYLIVSGEVTIRLREKDIAHLGPGKIFGEMAMLDDTPRTASAFASEKTLLFSIASGALTTKMPSLSYRIMANIAKQLSEKVRDSNERIHKVEAPM